jgi:hypothetical protein
MTAAIHFPVSSSVEGIQPVTQQGDRHPSLPRTDSLSPSTESKRFFSFDKPVLSPPLPSMSVIPFLQSVEKFHSFGQRYLGTQSKRLEQSNREIEKITTENIQKMREAAERASESDVWSFFKKIATAILSAISIVIGISLVASGAGALVGGAMIASGILSIANLVLSEAGFWEALAKRLAQDNEDKRRAIALMLPAIIGVVSGLIGVFGSVGSLAFSTLNFFEKALTMLHAAVGVLDGATTIGKGISDGQVIRADADLAQTRCDATLAHLKNEQVSTALEKVLKQLEAAQEKAAQMLKMLIQSNLQVVQG